MTSPQAWEPSQVNLSETRREQKSERRFCQISQTNAEARYEYIYLKTEQALLHYTEPSMVELKELLTMKIPRHINEESSSSIVPPTEPVKVLCNATRPGTYWDICIHTFLRKLSD